jgi:preprotein translocase subunit SecB
MTTTAVSSSKDSEVNSPPYQVAESTAPSYPLGPSFKVIKIYLKSSFTEQPNSPEIFSLSNNPEISYQIDLKQDTVSNDIFEVSITVTVTAKIFNKVAYIINVKQSGLFHLSNASTELTDEILNINCPVLLMPQLKSNLSDLVLRSGFNTFTVNDFDFKAIYAQKKFYLELQNKAVK